VESVNSSNTEFLKQIRDVLAVKIAENNIGFYVRGNNTREKTIT
jgi:hypothetical protein